MEYKQVQPPALLYIISTFTIGILYSLATKHSPYFLIIGIFMAVSFFTNFEVKVTQSTFSYKIRFYKFSLYKRILHPEDIREIRFTRTGWKEKKAIICTHKGRNVPLLLFTPSTIFAELARFSEENAITLIKTNEYSIVEKSERLKQESLRYERKRLDR
ncbi:hypothetical protein [Cytobacillus horneckiae]|uniref:Uncharacterized protein n=1 Tax=Cytobacillus horneckiae TaxID=549687 RepID=A0A2N0ZEH5_9BACI|nr:hypothetical protein [Cytobacillus horneckiae]MEC1154665.1 hypothetical protein [Cytobacillus horneckiae]MED2939006.1 hypothetical protein [Cytobacillus horneckiae]PKG27916.1 hypothetical protein CWS20_16135 [Cytobacillus horneckiae]